MASLSEQRLSTAPVSARAHSLALTNPKYRPDIDGLRAVAIILVVGFHAFGIQGGFIGVDVFFAISGFLISTIIFQNLEKGTFSFVEFYVRRIKRIFPALLIVLVATYIVGWFGLIPEEFKQLGKHVFGGAAFISNFLSLREIGYFDTSSSTKPLLHLWSLAIEEQFYLFWPLLLWIVSRRKWGFVATTAAVGALSFALNIYLVRFNPEADFFSSIARFWELMCGGFVAYIALHRPELNTKHGNAKGLIGLVLVVLGLASVGGTNPFPGWRAGLPVIGASLLISAGPKSWLNRGVLSNKALVWIGLISYPLYLWHWPILSFSRIVEGDTPSLAIRTVAVLAAILLAWLTYRFLERPIRFGRHSKATVGVLLCSMMVVGLSGLDCYLRNGLPSRLPDEVRYLGRVTDFDWYQFVRYDECHLQDYSLVTHAPYCVEGTRPLIALWGDSHAASLYPGLRAIQRKYAFGVAELTAAGCPPILDSTLQESVRGIRDNCYDVNKGVMQTLAKSRPDVLLLDSSWVDKDHLPNTNLLSGIANTVRLVKQELPTTRIVVIGPVPMWERSPQNTIFRAWFKQRQRERLQSVMQPALRLKEVDEALFALCQQLAVTYISAIETLCNSEGCVSRVGDGAQDWITIDYGHLSKAGSEYFIRKVQPLIIEDEFRYSSR